MASLNRAFLIGIVARPPAMTGDTWEFVLGVPEERPGGVRLQRVRVVAAGGRAEAMRELRAAQAVYAEGRLVAGREGTFLEATAVIPLGDPPEAAEPHPEPTGTHAPPRAHERAGHPRRLHAGTARERVVWVRPTRVGDPARPHRSRHRR